MIYLFFVSFFRDPQILFANCSEYWFIQQSNRTTAVDEGDSDHDDGDLDDEPVSKKVKLKKNLLNIFIKIKFLQIGIKKIGVRELADPLSDSSNR